MICSLGGGGGVGASPRDVIKLEVLPASPRNAKDFHGTYAFERHPRPWASSRVETNWVSLNLIMLGSADLGSHLSTANKNSVNHRES